jgi:dephospho-CoA kinase
MGKSTTADLFRDAGCDVWDADAAVHRLYEKGGAGVDAIAGICPEAIQNGAVSRDILRTFIKSDPDLLSRIEQVIHPLVAEDRATFLRNATSDIVVFDVPLLFETGGDREMDAVVCVYVPSEVQEARVLARGTMTLAQFSDIKSRQMPSDEKRERADYTILTDTIEHARAQVQTVLRQIRGQADARNRS